MPKYINPKGLRGRLTLGFAAVMKEFAASEGKMKEEAAKQGLTTDQLLAALLAEWALEEIAKGMN